MKQIFSLSENLELCSNEITLAALMEQEQVTIKPVEGNNGLRLEVTPDLSKSAFSKNLVSDIIQIVEKLDLSFSIKAAASVPVIVIHKSP